MQPSTDFDWRTIAALNAVSTLAQVGQFGIAFVMLPVWLAQQGLEASQLGLFAGSLWLGQLPGLALAPALCRRMGERRVIVLGLLCSLGAFVWLASAQWPWGLPGGLLAGLGLGLRWIGLEPWLYRIAPSDARGRLVGFHETLIALAPIVAPLLANASGMQGHAVFWIGSGFTLAALLPLAVARAPARDALAALKHEPLPAPAPAPAPPARQGLGALCQQVRAEPVLLRGLVIASVGGMMEAAVSGLFAVFAQDRGLQVSQTAELLAAFGLGGLLMQYGVGWLADHRGVGPAARLCALATVLVSLALLLPLDYGLLAGAVFLLGGFITAFLTLALIASTMATSGSMAGNVSNISFTYTLSAVAGPLLSGAAMQHSKGDALMALTAASAALMLALLVGVGRDGEG